MTLRKNRDPKMLLLLLHGKTRINFGLFVNKLICGLFKENVFGKPLGSNDSPAFTYDKSGCTSDGHSARFYQKERFC